MLTAVVKAFLEALHNLRANFFQTILSVLGIIIGVGALVAMLSLIDGLEAFAQEQISSKTSLESIIVTSNTHQKVDDIRIRRDTVARLNMDDYTDLMEALPFDVAGQLTAMGSKVLQHPATDSMMGVRYMASSLPALEDVGLVATHGRLLDATDTEKAVAVVNGQMAVRLTGNSEDTSAVIGSHFDFAGQRIEVVGVAKSDQGGEEREGLSAHIPLGVLSAAEIEATPNLIINFNNVEEVQEGKTFIEDWANERFTNIEEPVTVNSQSFWLEEMRKGFLIFRLIMGLVVGIAVVVGGVGVMNVLLMSINERTAEIGIRKAVGANRKSILSQFLAESVAVSVIGSVFGVVLGILVAMGVAPLLNYIQPELNFSAVLTLRTILTVAVIAILTGIIFGTYPARKAAGLDPVVAIQRT